VNRGSVTLARRGIASSLQNLFEYPTGRRNELDTLAVTLIDGRQAVRESKKIVVKKSQILMLAAAA
jgi:hypothetical protein